MVRAQSPGNGRRLFDEAPEPLLLASLGDLRLREVNQAAVEKFGYPRERLLSMTLADLHREADLQRLSVISETASGEMLELRGWETRTARGESIDTDVSVRFIEFDGERSILICTLDMTGRKALEERLRQAGKMEAIGMLAGGIAHDFNNLLTIISGYSQLLLNAVPEVERSSVEQILKASERAADLTGQLLAFSRRKELQPQALDVNSIVSGMSTMLRRLIGEHIELHLSLAPDLGTVHADPGQLDQVIMNLVVNARDAMSKGGKLMVETANVDLTGDQTGGATDDAAHLGLRPGHYIMIAVNDTGVGMDQTTRSRVFDPFFTTKEKGHGTGLGLSTVYRIVKHAGGTVDLYSEPLRGTSVKVFLPRAGEVERCPQDVYFDVEVAGGLETILVVEDEDAVRRLVRATLERRGYRVLVASGGPEALQIARDEPGIDLLITDLVMPQMSGVEVADRIREERRQSGGDLRILFMSGYTDRSLQMTDALPARTGFLQKPFTPDMLAARVREALDQNGRDGEQALASSS